MTLNIIVTLTCAAMLYYCNRVAIYSRYNYERSKYGMAVDPHLIRVQKVSLVKMIVAFAVLTICAIIKWLQHA